MTVKLGVIMDPIAQINPKKDTTLAMLLEAERRAWEIYVMHQSDVYALNGKAYGRMTETHVKDDLQNWYTSHETKEQPLTELDVILMRKDPPFNTEYIYTTYLLELAERDGVCVVNKPQSLRDANEKAYTAWFPQCCPETLISRDPKTLYHFHQQYHDVIYKPLEAMGGIEVFRVDQGALNLNVVIETLTQQGQRHIIAQRYIPEIKQGDKRILMIDGKAYPKAILRIPPEDDIRGNLAIGATAHAAELSDRDHWICEQIGPTLQEKGLLFAGIDVIGDYLTEINVTSPTCIREIDRLFNVNVAADLMDAIAARMATST